MNRLISIFICFFCFGSGLLFAQNTPYWQQKTDYTIQVRLDDKKHQLHGFETLNYRNNSPKVLDFLYIHLWPNAYKNNKTALAKQLGKKIHFASEEQRGFIDSLEFKVNGKEVRWEYDPMHQDIAKVFLNEPLKHGDSLILTTPFRVKLPGDFSRLGHVDQSYQISQWYPKPAVYDAQGWHPMPYLDQGEFYSEYGTFDVSISLPENYLVAATGVLQNEEERQFLLEKAHQTAATVQFEKNSTPPESATKYKTLRYIQDNIHDFAWFADKRYQVMHSEVKLQNEDRTVESWTFFLPGSATTWKNAVTYVDSALYYYSKWVGPYPYSHATAVEGALSAGGGMEYPMVTVISAGGNPVTLDQVVTHEVGHNWFYGILGSNERVHAWQDEGLNSYYEDRYMQKRYPDLLLSDLAGDSFVFELAGVDDVTYSDAINHLAIFPARRGTDQPIDTHSRELSSLNYGVLSYMRTAKLLTFLAAYLGQDTFDKAMQTYYDRWKFKHPQPADLQAVFEEVSGRELDWFFHDLLETRKQLNFTVTNVKSADEEYKVTVKNKENIKAPFSLSGIKNGRIIETRWYEGFEGRQTVTFPTGEYDAIVLDANHAMPEFSRSDNTYQLKGLFKRVEPLDVTWISGLEDDLTTKVHLFPAIGFNTADEFLLGLAIHNVQPVNRKFNYYLMPMFSFGRTDLAGYFAMKYDLLPKNAFNKIRLLLDYERFAGYAKLEPEVSFDIRPRNMTGKNEQRVSVKYSMIETASNLRYFYPEEYGIFTTDYQLRKENTTTTWLGDIRLQSRLEKSKFTTLQASMGVDHLLTKRKHIGVRLYGGKFLSDEQVDYPFWLGLSGGTDFLMEDILLDRQGSSDWLTASIHQRITGQGGFISYIPVFTNDWLATVNGYVDVPYLPLRLFADYGVVHEKFYDTKSHYDVGLTFKVIDEIFQIHIPVAGSQFKDDLPESFENFSDNIRFSITLKEQRLNPFKLLDKF